MKKLLIHLSSIRDSLHSQAEILRKQREVEFNKKINLLVSELCSYLNKDISKSVYLIIDILYGKGNNPHRERK